MTPTGHQTDQPIEANQADVQEQTLELIEDTVDPESSVAAVPAELDLSRASEADLAEQLHDVGFDDDEADR